MSTIPATVPAPPPGLNGSHPTPGTPPPSVPLAPTPITEDARLAILRNRIGRYQLVLALLTLVASIACWPLGVGGDTAGGPLLIGVLGGVAGSLVHTITVFSSRVGRSTFEASYAWWYVLRPFAAALLGLLFTGLVLSGVVAYTTPSATSSPVLPFVAGGLAGLFTDTVLQTFRALLGATNTEAKASDQHTPLAPEAAMIAKPGQQP